MGKRSRAALQNFKRLNPPYSRLPLWKVWLLGMRAFVLMLAIGLLLATVSLGACMAFLLLGGTVLIIGAAIRYGVEMLFAWVCAIGATMLPALDLNHYVEIAQGEEALELPVRAAATRPSITRFSLRDAQVVPRLSGHYIPSGTGKQRVLGYHVAPVLAQDWRPEDPVTLWVGCRQDFEATWKLSLHYVVRVHSKDRRS